MSVNGIVRRIDELGRIVIPKEIRRTMRLRVGDEMEIISEGEKLILRKYSEFEGFAAASKTVAQMIYDYVPSCGAFVVTADKLVAVAVKGKGRYENAVPTLALAKLVSARSSIVLKQSEVGALFEGIAPDEGTIVVEPVLSRGDVLGAVVVCSEKMPDENMLGYVRFASALLSAVISE